MKYGWITAAVMIGGLILHAHADLVAYWDFEPGNRYDDKSGNGANGSAGANVGIDPDSPVGEAVAIGVSAAIPDEIVTIAQADAPAFGVGDFSFSFWVNRADTAADSNGVDGVFDVLRDTTQGFQALFLAPTASDKFRFRMDEPGPDFLLADSTASIAPDGSWRHLAVTVDRDDPEGLSIYLDGQLDSVHDPTSVSGDLNPLQDLWIGGINGSAVLGLDGSLDDLAFYDVVLNPTQILALASEERTPLTVFAPPLALQLEIIHDDGILSIAWQSREGMLYNLRSTPDPVGLGPPAEWPLFNPDGDARFQEIAATPPKNALTFPLPSTRERYFVLEEFPEPPEVIFHDDFEGGQGGWNLGSDGQPGTAWELGMPSGVGPVSAHSPENCFATNLATAYSTDANVWLRSPPLDLTSAPAATLSYFRFLDIEPDFDRGEVSVLDASDDSLIAVIESNIDGSSTTWEQVSENIPAAALGKTVVIEFRLSTDNLDNLAYAGFYVDDVEVTVP